LPDDQIVLKALEEKRTIMTHDLDFGRIVALSGRTVPSIVTFRLSNMSPASVSFALEAVLIEASAALEKGALVTVTDQGSKVRVLPVGNR